MNNTIPELKLNMLLTLKCHNGGYKKGKQWSGKISRVVSSTKAHVITSNGRGRTMVDISSDDVELLSISYIEDGVSKILKF